MSDTGQQNPNTTPPSDPSEGLSGIIREAGHALSTLVGEVEEKLNLHKRIHDAEGKLRELKVEVEKLLDELAKKIG